MEEAIIEKPSKKGTNREFLDSIPSDFILYSEIDPNDSNYILDVYFSGKVVRTPNNYFDFENGKKM